MFKTTLIHLMKHIIASCYTINLSAKKALFKPAASYLLFGGMGGLGRAVALRMLEHGARHFIFASRGGLDCPEACDLKATVEASQARAIIGKCNIIRKANFESGGSRRPPRP